MTDHEPQFISPSQLCVGLYVHLDVTWIRHPFALSHFKIKDEAQIHTIRALGLEQIRYDPLRSDCLPLPLESASHNVQPAPPENIIRVAFPSEPAQRRYQAILECEQQFARATTEAHLALNKVVNKPQDGMLVAERLINGMVDQVFLDGNAIIQVMDSWRLGEDTFCHPLNVTVLCLMMAKALKLSVGDARCLGMAALFHDIGKAEIPSSVLMNDSNLNHAELSLLQQHAEYGASIIKNAGKNATSERIANLIAQHHECFDGSGYPAGLKGEALDPLTPILSLVNAYDNLCSCAKNSKPLTPYGALSYLFASERKKYDRTMLNLFIKLLGIYPPGSVVQLSDGAYGIVVSANPQQLMRPLVMLHDKKVEREIPIFLDLGEDEDTDISQCLLADQLPKEVAEYLQCRQKLSYYFRVESSTEHPTNA